MTTEGAGVALAAVLDAVALLRGEVATLSRHTAEIQSSQQEILLRLDTIDAGQAGVTDLLPMLEAILGKLITDGRVTQEGLSNLPPILEAILETGMRDRERIETLQKDIISRLDARSATSTVDTGSTETVTGAIHEGLAEMAPLLEAILNTSARGHEGIEALRQDLRDRPAAGDAGVGATANVVDALDAISTRQQEDGKASREGFADILSLASQLVEGAHADRKQNRETFKQIGETAAFAHSAALGHREPLPVSVGDYAVLERFIIAQPADLTSNERALVDWRNVAKDEGTAELVDILKSQYQPSPTDTPETRVLRFRLAAITRATIKGRGAELPAAPTSTRAVDRSAVACMIRSSELAQLWRAGESTELYAEPELAGALDLFILAERRVGPIPEAHHSPELVALHRDLATKIETGNRSTLGGTRPPRAADRVISAEPEVGR